MRGRMNKMWTKWRSPQGLKMPWQRRKQKGLTLIELLVSSLLVSVVMLVAWSGLISLLNMSAISEAKGMRAIEINKALDFLSTEIRTARRVNSTASGQLNAATSLTDLLQNDGFDLNRLGNYGDIVLYLEVPSPYTPPAICPAGGPNAGSPPPSPSAYDQVIYDVRPSPDEWLSPKVTMRYGRIKDENGLFNPCDSPVAGDPVADALSDQSDNLPTCSGVLTGGPGFYACQEQRQTNLFFQNKLVDSSVEQSSIVATPRLDTIQTATLNDVGCHNEGGLRANAGAQKIPSTSIVNSRNSKIKLFNLDNLGNRDFVMNIPANSQANVPDLLSNPWVFTDVENTCLQIVIPQNTNSEMTVVIPADKNVGLDISQPNIDL